MAMGPLDSFVFPGVYTRTTAESTAVSAAGDIRFPAFIGVSNEEIDVSNFELVRGSSALADNIVLDEAVYTDGTTNKFTVKNFPIVVGDGSGRVTDDPKHVIVTINGNSVLVNSVDGLTGEVTLAEVPRKDSLVRVNYYFKRRDTYIENENLSVQANGSNTTFKVNSLRIVTGDNSGSNANNDNIGSSIDILYNPDPNVVGDEFERTVSVIEVKINGVSAPVANIEGSEGTITLQSAPSEGAEVLVSYFTNLHQDTYDILPAAYVNRITKAGLSQDTNDFSQGRDFALDGDNKIHWGHSYDKEIGKYTAGSDPLTDNIVVSLTDTKVFGVVATPLIPSIDDEALNSEGNFTFTLPSTPVDGHGLGTPTEDPRLVTAYVGETWVGAKSSGPVGVASVSGNNVTLTTMPEGDELVYVTYYENNLVEDRWTLTNKVPGSDEDGRYTLESQLFGDVLDVTVGGVTGDIAPEYEVGSSAPSVSPSHNDPETVTIAFNGDGKFTVTSDGRTGSVTDGDMNTGYLGKTYTDPRTGFKVTFNSDVDYFNKTEPVGGVEKAIIYKVGNPGEESATSISTSESIKSLIPGVNLVVSSTDGGTQHNDGDTVLMKFFNKSGQEPKVGDLYYVSLVKAKVDFGVKFFTSMKDLIRYAGPISIHNKLTLAANLAFINGARAVAIKQIKRIPGQNDATVQDYIRGIDVFNEPLPNGLRPTFVQPLTTNLDVISYLKTSNAIQSGIRYRNERTSIFGFGTDTRPEEVIKIVRNTKSEKMTAVYPDGAVLGITDNFGNEVEYVVDGSMLAAALTGRDVSPVGDIATPLTNASLIGFKRLYRRVEHMDALMIANAGCTVLEDRTPVIKVLMYLTTDTTDPMTRNPRIVEIKHFVQQGVRRVLDRFIGSKNLARVRPQIRDTAASYFKDLKDNKELITDFTDISITQSEQDPSTLDFEALYKPVFGIDWIMVNLNISHD